MKKKSKKNPRFDEWSFEKHLKKIIFGPLKNTFKNLRLFVRGPLKNIFKNQSLIDRWSFEIIFYNIQNYLADGPLIKISLNRLAHIL